jgi:type II secretory pathway pseudopilin PulG
MKKIQEVCMRNSKQFALHYFTLVELLVVITVLAILMSLFVPALRRSMKLARVVVCKSNLGQISTAALVYADDFMDYFPSGPHNSNSKNWKFGRDYSYHVNPSNSVAYKLFAEYYLSVPANGLSNIHNGDLNGTFICPELKVSGKPGSGKNYYSYAFVPDCTFYGGASGRSYNRSVIYEPDRMMRRVGEPVKVSKDNTNNGWKNYWEGSEFETYVIASDMLRWASNKMLGNHFDGDVKLPNPPNNGHNNGLQEKWKGSAENLSNFGTQDGAVRSYKFNNPFFRNETVGSGGGWQYRLIVPQELAW